MSKETILKVLREMAVKPFGKKPVAPYDLEGMAALIEQLSAQYKVDARLALAQGLLECHWGFNPAARRSIKTRNIFNVGNVDTGGNRYFTTWEAGVRAYFALMAREYCWRNEGDTVTAEMMIRHNFSRPKGGRYATASNYSAEIAKLVAKIDRI